MEDGVIIWNITGGCNLNCPYCMEGPDKPKHPIREEFEKRLENPFCRALKAPGRL